VSQRFSFVIVKTKVMPMRVSAVEVFPLTARLQNAFHWSTGTVTSRHAVLVRIVTDEGTVGWGEALAPATCLVIREAIGPELLGMDPANRAMLLPRLCAAAGAATTSVAVAAEAIGAIEVALLDVAARAADWPLCRMLARVCRNRVNVYASSIYYSDEEEPNLTSKARDWLKRGFAGIKIKVGRVSTSEDLSRVTAIRRAIGPEPQLMVDANQAYNARSTMEFAQALVPFNVAWLEEPVPAHDIAAYREVKRNARIPIAAGENLHSPEEFEEFLGERLLDVVQPNVARVGGLVAALRIVRCAAASDTRVAFHHWGTPIGLAASLHLACCVPSDGAPPLVEVDCSPNPLREIVERTLPDPFCGTMSPPLGPGLGVTPCERALARYLS